MFENEKRLPDIAQQFSKPLEEKMLMAYSMLDELEHQVEDVEERVNDIEEANGGSKRKEPSEYSESEEEEEQKLLNVQKVEGEEVDKDSLNLSVNVSESENRKKSRRGRRKPKKRKSIVKAMLAKIGSKSAFAAEEGSSDFRDSIEQRIKDLEHKIKFSKHIFL